MTNLPITQFEGIGRPIGLTARTSEKKKPRDTTVGCPTTRHYLKVSGYLTFRLVRAWAPLRINVIGFRVVVLGKRSLTAAGCVFVVFFRSILLSPGSLAALVRFACKWLSFGIFLIALFGLLIVLIVWHKLNLRLDLARVTMRKLIFLQ